MKFTVAESAPLLEILAKVYPDSSKTTLRSLIKDQRVEVNGAVIKESGVVIAAGKTLTVGAKQRRTEGGLPVLFEDSHIIVLNKPAKMLSVASATETERTVHSFLKEKYKKVFVVHRLDKGTSGVMLFAKSQEAYDILYGMFERHELTRRYVGIVEGIPETFSGVWESYLREDAQYKVYSSPRPGGGGVLAKTHFEVLKAGKNYSLIRFTLETGKKNQIRVHAKEAKCPLIGDKKYSAKTNPLKRLGLHAELLEFLHPITKAPLSFHLPFPKEFQWFLVHSDLA